MKSSDYKLLNFIFAGIIGLVFVYFGIFSAQKCNYPIHSACITQDCSSTGLSRAFSEIVRLDFSSALEYNRHSLWVFSFFVIQFFQRLFLNYFIGRICSFSRILIADITFSVTLFIITFWSIFNF